MFTSGYLFRNLSNNPSSHPSCCETLLLLMFTKNLQQNSGSGVSKDEDSRFVI